MHHHLAVDTLQPMLQSLSPAHTHARVCARGAPRACTHACAHVLLVRWLEWVAGPVVELFAKFHAIDDGQSQLVVDRHLAAVTASDLLERQGDVRLQA